MKLSKEDARELVWGDLDGWEVVGEPEITDQRRWVTVHECLFKHIESGSVFNMWWEEGSTECQETELFEYYDPELTEMVEKEVTHTIWVEKGEE